MKVLKAILKFFMHILLLPVYLIIIIVRGFNTIALFLSRGFYFFLEKLFVLLKKITHISGLQFFIDYFSKYREEPGHVVLMIVWFFAILYLFDSFYIDHGNMVTQLSDEPTIEKEEVIPSEEPVENVDKDEGIFSQEFNLYRIYGKYKTSDINIGKLKNDNSDTIAWLKVEGTNINYPIVQTDNNDYYLLHSFDRTYTHNGWTFMDYRNNRFMTDQNTIFYGHNLLNGTAFGSISWLFKSNNHKTNIMVITEDQKKYVYQIFSGYLIDPEIYYLQTNFYDDSSYQEFLNTISSRNILKIDSSVNINDKIITLSTCTDDNLGRRVIHAKLISVE